MIRGRFRSLPHRLAAVAVAGLTASGALAAMAPSARAAARGRAAVAPGTVVSYAGSPASTAGNTGDGGAATSALMNGPGAIAVDGADNVYVADSANNRIRKIDPGGIITDYAGWANGTAGDNGDNIQATVTELRDPGAIAVDPSGNVYIADTGNSRVRKVNTSGVITQFIGDVDEPGNSGDGGPARSASISFPSAVAVDAAGNVYVADPSHARIRVVNPDGIINNFAGDGIDPAGKSGDTGDAGPATSALLAGPEGLAVDAAGDVYIADSGNNRVRKVSPDGIITNFAGDADGTPGDTGDGGAATSATLNDPEGLAVDAAGNVYISDDGNNRIRKVDTNGIITNFAGEPDGTAGDTGDGGPATSATLTAPSEVAVDSAGDVYFSDFTDNQVREVVGSQRVAPAFTADSPSTTAATSAPYEYTFAATGLPGPTFTLASGALPPGLTLDSSTGVLSGTPTQLGSFTFAVNAGNGVASPVATSPSVAIDVVTAKEPPSVTSLPATTFTVAAAGTFTVTTGGYPTPSLSETGAVPAGVTFVDNHDGTATLAGTPATGVGGTFPLTVKASNGIGAAASQALTLTVDQAPMFTSAASMAMTVGVAATLTVTSTGLPAPTVTESGTLPAGVTFNAATGVLSGTPAQATSGTYPIVLRATNGVNGPATSDFTLTVDQAVFTQPTDGEANVDAIMPFTWSTIGQAQAYDLIVGTTHYGADLLNTGVLPPTTSTYTMPAMPSGPTIYATLFAEVSGGWTSYQAISFTALPNVATFTYPLNEQAGVDPTRPITWSNSPFEGGTILVVGTAPDGSNLFNSGIMVDQQDSASVPVFPAGEALYATLLTNFNGKWDRFQAITFTDGPAAGTFTEPVNGQLKVATPTTFTWNTITGAQDYDLVVGTTLYGTDLVSSGILPPTQSSFSVAKLPSGKVLYATLLTEVNGQWTSEVVGFTAA